MVAAITDLKSDFTRVVAKLCELAQKHGLTQIDVSVSPGHTLMFRLVCSDVEGAPGFVAMVADTCPLGELQHPLKDTIGKVFREACQSVEEGKTEARKEQSEKHG